MTAGDDTTEPLDRTFEVLRHAYRRRVLVSVREHNPVERGTFVEEIATEDDDTRTLETSLHHVHLPKLARAGYIEWDPDEGMVRRGPAFDEVAPVLELLDEYDERLPDGWP